jgi:hypothetical protein
MSSARPAFPCEGGCACGSVRYRLLEMPLELHACHCTDCQRLTGSAFVMSMAVGRSALELLRGEPAMLAFETPEGLAKRNTCCPRCGSRLWGEPQRYPDLLILRPGTLDDPSWAEPTAHIWTRSAQPWVAIPKDVLSYEQQPDDPLEMARAWQRRWKE